MSSSKVLNNLNIRKFPSLESYKSATIGEDDLNVVMGGKPLIQVTALPTPSADWYGEVVQLIADDQQGDWRNGFFMCEFDGTNYYWTQVWTQPETEAIKVNTTATLAVADWSSNTQTVTVSGVAADSVVFVSPAPASASDYASAGILCTAQAADSLTFACTTTPTNAITVNVVCM